MKTRTYYVSDPNARPWRVSTRRPSDPMYRVRASSASRARQALEREIDRRERGHDVREEER